MPDRDSPLVAELRRRLGDDRVLNSAEDLAVYAYDGTAVLRQNPGCVVFPRTTDEVAACVRAAREAKTPIVTRGSGTGLSGGSVPIEGCLVLCLTDMNRVLAVDVPISPLTPRRAPLRRLSTTPRPSMGCSIRRIRARGRYRRLAAMLPRTPAACAV